MLFTADPPNDTAEGRMRRRRMLQTALIICLMLLLLDSGPPPDSGLRGDKGKGLDASTRPPAPAPPSPEALARLNAYYESLPPSDYVYARNATGSYRGEWARDHGPEEDTEAHQRAEESGLKLSRRKGRALLELHMEDLPEVDALSAVHGYLRLMDGYLTTTRDVILAVQGVVFHRTGKLTMYAVEKPRPQQWIELPVPAQMGPVNGTHTQELPGSMPGSAAGSADSFVSGSADGLAAAAGAATVTGVDAYGGRRRRRLLPGQGDANLNVEASGSGLPGESILEMPVDAMYLADQRRAGRPHLDVLLEMAQIQLRALLWGIWDDWTVPDADAFAGAEPTMHPGIPGPSEAAATGGGADPQWRARRRLDDLTMTNDVDASTSSRALVKPVAAAADASNEVGLRVALPTGFVDLPDPAPELSRAGVLCQLNITGDVLPRVTVLPAEPSEPDAGSAPGAAAEAMRHAGVMAFDLSARSEVCDLRFNVTLSALRVDWKKASAKATNYSMAMTLAAVLQIAALLKQLQHTSTQAAAARMSLVCVAMQALMDALICILHLLLCVVVQSLFAAFASIAFFKLIIFCIFEMRYMVVIFQARQDQDFFSGGWAEIRRRLAALHARFYGVLMALIVFIFVLNKFAAGMVPLFLLVGHSFWVPQILSNIRRESRAPLCRPYLVTMSLTRLLVPLYLYGCPANLFNTFEGRNTHTQGESGSRAAASATNGLFCITLVLWVGAQTLVLILQEKLGPHFFVPAMFLPPKYNYRRPIPPEMVEAGEETTCVICISELEDTQTNAVMVAPCGHAFHDECLLRWMEERAECPTCRQALPPA